MRSRWRTSTFEVLSGGCLCGDVRYQADAAPFHETICHCRSCRMAAGAASVAWCSVPAASLRWTGAAPTTFRSSSEVERSFCGRCGTTLTYRHDHVADEIDVTIATLDAPDTVPPRDHTETSEALVWSAPCDGLPVYRERRGV